MAMESKLGPMALVMKVLLLITEPKEKVNSIMLRVVLMKVNSRMIKPMEKETIKIIMVLHTQVNLLMTYLKVKEWKCGLMEQSILVNIKQNRSTEKAPMNGQMEISMKAPGMIM